MGEPTETEDFDTIPVYVPGDVPCEDPDEEPVPTWPVPGSVYTGPSESDE